GRFIALCLSLMFASVAGQAPDSRVLEVSFAGGRNIERDDGSGPYQAPHWRGSNAQYPYLMKAGDVLKVAKAKFQISGSVSRGLVVRGSRDDALGVPRTVAAKVGGTADIYQIADVPVAAPFKPNQIAFYERFEIRWEVSRDGGGRWEPAGVSS